MQKFLMTVTHNTIRADPGIFKGGGGGGGGGGGIRRNFLQRGGGGGGVQPLTQEQFVLQISKIFSKRGGGGGRTPWICPYFAAKLELNNTLTTVHETSQLPTTVHGHRKQFCSGGATSLHARPHSQYYQKSH